MYAEDSEVLQLSRKWTELTGYALADLPTLEAWLALAHVSRADAVRDQLHELFGGARLSLDLEFAIRTRDGGERYWTFSASSPGTLGDGRRFVVGMAVDITERRRAEQELRQSESRFRAVVDLVPDVIWQNDPSGAADWFNRRWLDYTGQTLEQARAYGWFDVIHPDDRERSRSMFQRAVDAGQPLRLEYRIRRASDGAFRWFLVQALPLHDEAGRITTWFGTATEIHDQRIALEALREGEERLRLIVESATDYAIYTLDPGRRVTGWNPGSEATFGYAEREIVGRPHDILFTPEDRADGVPAAEAETARRDGRAADERWHLRQDGSRFYASGVLTPMGDGGSLGFVKVLRDLTDRKRMEDDLRQARDELEARVAERTAELMRANAARVELLRRLVRVQEDERRRVSRELHDGLGQELTALMLGLKELERAIPEGSPGRGRLREVEASVGRIGREAHDLAVELRPSALDDIGLGPALATYVAKWSERTGVAADFQSPGQDAYRLPPEVETALYRVVQEALNNIAKHAAAHYVSVIVERRPGEVTTLVEDDGKGFDPDQLGPAPERRLGIIGMRERLALLDGTLLIESGEGAGTTLRARIPLPEISGEAGHGG